MLPDCTSATLAPWPPFMWLPVCSFKEGLFWEPPCASNMLPMGNLSHKRQDLFSGVCSMVGKTDDRLLTAVQSGVGTGAVGARVGRTEGRRRDKAREGAALGWGSGECQAWKKSSARWSKTHNSVELGGNLETGRRGARRASRSAYCGLPLSTQQEEQARSK